MPKSYGENALIAVFLRRHAGGGAGNRHLDHAGAGSYRRTADGVTQSEVIIEGQASPHHLKRRLFYRLITVESRTFALGKRLADKYQLRVIDITSGIDTEVTLAAILQRLDNLTRVMDQCS